MSATKAGRTSEGYIFHLPPLRARSWSMLRRKDSMAVDGTKSLRHGCENGADENRVPDHLAGDRGHPGDRRALHSGPRRQAGPGRALRGGRRRRRRAVTGIELDIEAHPGAWLLA